MLRCAGFDPLVAVRLREVIRELKPDVVVAHGGETLKYAVVTLPKRTALVYKKTGISAGSIRWNNQRRLLGVLMRRANVVAAVAEEAAVEAVQLFGVPADRVFVTPNGRDPSRFTTATSGRGGDCAKLVFVGHLTTSKRPESFLAAVEALRGRGVAIEAVIVGDGPLREDVRRAAARSDVEVLGHRDDVGRVLAGCDLLVFPGSPEGEGMPGVLIEAGLAGLPSVTTAVSGASTVVQHGVTGFVVPVSDLDALIDATQRLATDPELRRQMGTAARRRCLEQFTLESSVARWQAIFDHVLGRKVTDSLKSTVPSDASSFERLTPDGL